MFTTPSHTILKALTLVLLFQLLALLPPFQPLMASPRLTVVVMVDGLRQDNLDLLRPYWGQGGLRTLSEEAYQNTYTFPHEVYGGNETTASLMTGLTPAHNGYAMDQYFRRSDRLVHRLLDDPQEKGINSSLSLSARALFAPTMSDLLRMHAGSQAKIYAIGIHPETTILLAGHSANACAWLDTDKQAWAGSSYYSEGLPAAADAMNVNGRMAELAAHHWTPRLAITSYMSPTEEEQKKPFDYVSSTILTTSPTANAMVVELALALQEQQQLGLDAVPDMLLLEMTTVTPKASSDKIQSAEQEDIYLWLNQDLGFLIEQLVKRIGRSHFDLIVLGRPVYGVGHTIMEMAGLPIQECSADRIAALTSTYLMAIYGHERWIDGAYGPYIYLNRKLIEQRKLSLATMQRQVADFLMEFDGIQTAFPIRDALLHPEFREQINKYLTADVFFSVLPEWQLFTYDHPVDQVMDITPSAPLLYWSSSYLPMPTQPLSATDICNLIK